MISPQHREHAALGLRTLTFSWDDRQAPGALNGTLRRGHYRTLNDEVIRSWSEPDPNWDTECSGRSDEPAFPYEWVGPGCNTVNSGPPRLIEAGAMRPVGFRPDRIPTEPAWLFGRMPFTEAR